MRIKVKHLLKFSLPYVFNMKTNLELMHCVAFETRKHFPDIFVFSGAAQSSFASKSGGMLYQRESENQ